MIFITQSNAIIELSNGGHHLEENLPTHTYKCNYIQSQLLTAAKKEP